MKLAKENFMLFNDNWALVTAGSLTHYNTMTISWGSLGCIWNGEDSARPIVSVYVKPCRYTHDFIEKNEIFTVTFFDKKYKPDLGILGRESGRDGDKVAKNVTHSDCGWRQCRLQGSGNNNSLQKNI